MCSAANVVHLMPQNMHAAYEYGYRPLEVLRRGGANVYVDEANRPVFRHIGRNQRNVRTGTLVPTFRSSCFIAATSFSNFGTSWALAYLLILVPLYRSEVPDRTRRLWCRDFRSAVLAWDTNFSGLWKWPFLVL